MVRYLLNLNIALIWRWWRWWQWQQCQWRRVEDDGAQGYNHPSQATLCRRWIQPLILSTNQRQSPCSNGQSQTSTYNLAHVLRWCPEQGFWLWCVDGFNSGDLTGIWIHNLLHSKHVPNWADLSWPMKVSLEIINNILFIFCRFFTTFKSANQGWRCNKGTVLE